MSDDLKKMCIRVRELEGDLAELEGDVKNIKAELEELKLKKIPDLMQTLDIRNITFDGIGRVQLASDIYASTREGQKARAMDWLRDCGYDDMITETYNASSLKALFRRQLAEGIDIPDDIFSVHPFTRASIVKV